MSGRNGGSNLNAGTFAPKKYAKYTVEYGDCDGGGTTTTYRYYGPGDVLMLAVEIEFDTDGRDIRGEIIANGFDL